MKKLLLCLDTIIRGSTPLQYGVFSTGKFVSSFDTVNVNSINAIKTDRIEPPVKFFKKYAVLLALAAFFLLPGLNKANAATTWSTTGITGTAANLSTSQSNIAILGFKIVTTANRNVTAFTFNVNSSANAFLSTYFTGVTLYHGTSPAFTLTGGTAATPVTGATFANLGTANPSVTGFTDAVNTTTEYYWIVVNYTLPNPSFGDTFSLTAATATVSAGNPGGTVTGPSYTIPSTYNTVTLTSLGAGGAAPTSGLSGNPIVTSQTNIPVYGFSLVGSGTGTAQTITSLSFTNSAGFLSNSTYFGTISLYSSSSTTFPGVGNAGATLVTSVPASTTSTTNTFNTLSISVPTGTTLYYFVVINDALTATNNFEIDYASVGGASLTTTNYTGFDYAIDNIYIGPATTTGLATNPLSTSQTGISIASFSIVNGSGAALKVRYIEFTNTQPSTYMANYTLYYNTTNSVTGLTAVPGAVLNSTTSTTPYFTIPNPYESIPANTTYYFFVEVNYTYPAPATSSTYQLTTTGIQTSGGTTYTAGAPQAGPLYTIPAATPTVSYAATTPAPPYVFYQGISVGTGVVPTSTFVKTTGGFAISPSLPAGLTFDVNTGDITGAATATSPNTQYTVTVTATGGATGSTQFYLSVVLPAAPLLITYPAPSPLFVFSQNSAITAATPTVSGMVPAAGAFSIENLSTLATSTTSVPGITGLVFNANTGQISGTPSTLQAATSYTVTVTNAGGSATTTFSIACVAPPVFAYPQSTYIFTTNLNIGSLVIPTVSSGGPVTTYSISPALPATFTFNTGTGQITGTPTATLAAGTYTVTGTNATTGGVGTTTLTISVVAPPVFAYATETYTTGLTITPLSPTGSGTPLTNATISGLPSGLSISSAGVISGTPNTVTGTTTYTVTATGNNGGTGTGTTTITVVSPPVFNYASQVFTYGTTITSFGPTGTGAPVTGATISPALPAGLTINGAGTIMGKPTTVSALTTYTVTATGSNGGIGTASFTITVNPASLTITANNQTKTYGATNPTLTVTYTGFVNGDTKASLTTQPTVSTTAVTASPVGTYPITATGAVDNNYTISYVSGTLTVNPATLTITANNVTKTYGATLTGGPGSTAYTETGLATGDNITGVTIAYGTGSAPTDPVGTDVGSVVPSAATGSFNPANYTIVYDPGNIIVKKAPLTITASNVTKNYGTTLTSGAGNTAFTSTGLQNGETIGSVTITYGTGSAATAAVGTYTGQVVPSAASDATGGTFTATNYTISYTDGSITVIASAPALTYASTSYAVGAAFTLTPTNGGSPATGASISGTSPALPAGVNISATGVISGTYSGAAGTFGPYTVIATNSVSPGGTTSNSFTITFVTPPTISYPPGTFALTAGTSTSISPMLGGGAVANFAFGTGATLTGTPPLNTPYGIAINPKNGDIYVTNSGTGTISYFTAAGAYIGRFANGYTTPVGIVFDSSGNAYIADQGTDDVYKITAAGVKSTLLAGFDNLTGIGIDASNNLYVVDGGYFPGFGNDVYKFSTTGTLLTTLSNTNIPNPAGVAVSGSGNVYVVDNDNDDVVEYNSSGAYVSTIATGFNGPEAIAVDASGNIYVSDTGNNQVEVYNSSGMLLTTVTGLNNPYGITVDGSGNLYVVNQATPSVVKYPPVGGYTISGALPAGLTFNTSNGVISGAPTGAFTSVTYTITCYNAAGSGNTMVTLSCTITTPAFHYTPATNVYSLGVAIATLSPIITSGTIGPPGFGSGTTIASGLNEPKGVSIDGSGNVYVVNSGTKTVSKYNSAGVLQGTFETVGGGFTAFTTPTSITFDAAGNAYVLDQGANKIYVFNSAGAYQKTITPPAGYSFANGFGIAYNSTNGNLYITNSGNAFFGVAGSIEEITTAGAAVATITTAPITTPEGIVIDASGNIYEADSGTGAVYKFSSSGTYISTIVTGLNPYGLGIDAAGDLYVGSAYNYFTGAPGGLYEYSPTGALITSISGLTNPQGIAIDSKGDAWVSDETNGTFIEYPYGGGYTVSPSLPPGLVFNNTTGTFTGTPTTTFGPITYTVTGNSYGVLCTTTVTLSCVLQAPNIAYTPATNVFCLGTAITALTPVNSGGPVLAMTFAGGAAITGATLNAPYGAAINPLNNDIYITNSGSGTISYYNAAGVYQGTFGTGWNQPVGIVFDALGNAYVIDRGPGGFGGTGSLYEVTAAGAKSTLATNFSSLRGIAISPSGNLYITNGGSDNIYEYTTGGSLVATFPTTYTAYPNGIAVSPAGNVYVLDRTNNNVVEFTSGGTYVTTFATGFNTAYGISIDAAGNVYIADSGNNKIDVYNSIGTLLTSFTSNLNGPYGLVTDSNGDIFVANDANNGVYEYLATGNYSITPALPAGLTFNTVTGTISGTPTALSAAANYTVSCSNSVGPDNTTVNIGVGTTPTVNYVSPQTYLTNTAVTLTPTVTGIPTTYTVSPALPTGLTISATTGVISGSPTVVTAAANYTVTATNNCGMATFPVNITVNLGPNTDDWTGTISNDWNTAANWSTGVVPSATVTAQIGVNQTFLNFPNLGPVTPATNSVLAVLIGSSSTQVTAGTSLTAQAGGFVVGTGSVLNVTNNITYQSDANAGTLTAAISGGGTVNAAGVNVTANTTLPATYTETMATSVSALNISGNITLSSTDNAGTSFNATLNITGGITALAGTVTTSNITACTSTLAVIPTPGSTATLQFANATPLSGLAATGINIFSALNAGATVEYSGAAQTVYTDATVTNLSNTISYQNIKFSGTGIKTPTTGNLNIAGDFTNTLVNDAADYVPLATTPVYFNGAAAQNIYAGAGNGTVFNNITFENSGATTIQSGMAYVDDSGLLTMAGTATLNAGGFLTLVSDATGNAAVAPITSGTPISGTVNVQRYIAGIRGYRLLSSPVYAGTSGGSEIYSVNYLLNSLYLTGSGGGFTNPGNPTLYLYDEGFVPQYSTFLNSNFVGVSSLTGGTGNDPTYTVNVNGAGLTGAYTLPVSNGYYCFYRGNLSEGQADLTNPSYTGVLPTSVTASGTLVQGQVQFADWYSPTSTYLGAASQNYNLVGNPYASAIDLNTVQGGSTTTGIYATTYNAVAGTGISQFIYELNPVSNIYGIYTPNNVAFPPTNGASEYIASGQGFFVQAYGANTSQLIFNENAKATSPSANAEGLMARRVNSVAAAINPGVQNPVLLMRLALDTINYEEAVISFNPKAKSTYVINEDAPHKTGGGLVAFSSSTSDNQWMSINSMPLQASQVVPLSVTATKDGQYTINMKQLAPMPALFEVWLKDAYLKDSLDIKNNPVYTFSIAHADTSSFGNYRFSLVMRENPGLMVHLLSFNAVKLTAGDNVTWTVENEANYTHFDVQRSTDGGKTYVTLDSLVSSSIGSYSYLDGKPAQGADSYRLQLTDVNGLISYSAVITIMYANTGDTIALNGMMVYPNPTTGPMNLAINVNSNASNGLLPSPSYHIQVTNNLGIVIKNTTSSQPVWQTDLSALLPGTYFITVTNDSNNTLVGRSAFVKL